jgi:hypothetical protein
VNCKAEPLTRLLNSLQQEKYFQQTDVFKNST